eukprot:GHVR01154404.1.p2 GENE.GHVR01154404.1~~GHVR01154404.1.p2  ORF type:complete len:128 (-),score=12.77 GHVR01154404.1:824-1207(-)
MCVCVYMVYVSVCNDNVLCIEFYIITRRTMKLLTIYLVVFVLIMVKSKQIYDFKKSYVTQLTDFNFKDQVNKIRKNPNSVSIVPFYKEDDGQSVNLVPEIDEWNNEYDGVFRVGASDCETYPSICAN